MSDATSRVIGGRYQILATLGQGGMGLVYKAYDPVLDRLVALKKMVATVVDGEDRRARFYIEARAAARLNHPNIVTIHELEEHAGDVYIVMELLEGVSLAAFMQAGGRAARASAAGREPRVPLSLAGCLTILAQVAEGLHYAHARSIVHRDIKPANLVLTTAGSVKVLDFGIAQLASQAITKAGAMLGTPHYMAPEQIKDEPVDARADLFSLGAVAYELVTGVKPFAAESIAAVLMQIACEPHVPVREAAPDTPPALAKIIDGLLAKDRTARPASGAALSQALERIGEIDRVDLVAEAVRAVLGPASGDAVFASMSGKTPVTPPPVSLAPADMPPGSPATVACDADAETDANAGPNDRPDEGPPAATPDASAPTVAGFALEEALTSASSPTIASAEAPTFAASQPAMVSADVVTSAPPLAIVPGDAPTSRSLPVIARAEVQTRASSPLTMSAETPSMPPPLPSAPSRGGGGGGDRDVAARVEIGVRPVRFVDAGVPQARTRHGSGVMFIVLIAALLLLAFAAAGMWGYLSLRGTWTNSASSSAPSSSTTPSTTTSTPAATPATPVSNASPDASVTAPTSPAAAPPTAVLPAAEPTLTATTSAMTAATSAATTPTPAVATGAAPLASSPVPADVSTAAPVTPAPPNAPAVAAPTSRDRAASTATASVAVPSSAPPPNAPSAASAAARAPTSGSNGAAARDTSRPAAADTRARNVADAAPSANAAAPREQGARRVPSEPAPRDATPEVARRSAPGDVTRGGEPANVPSDVTGERAPRDAPRDVAREPAGSDGASEAVPREPAEQAEAAEPARRPLDAGSLAAFQGSSRSSTTGLYGDAPSAAASVARVTYTIEAYSAAIANRDVEALRDVRSPVTPAEAAWLKEGATVRFTNLDVRVSGASALVRCRRAIVADGKTRASGAVEVQLTRRPSGWVITDIR